MKRHRCHRLPRTIEIIYDETWNCWTLFSGNDAIDVLYCPFCGAKL